LSHDLVFRARNGDHEAFTALAAASFDGLFRLARLILRDDELAADAVQNALLSAWLHIRAVREPERFEAWLRRLVVRACYRESSRTRRLRAIEVRYIALDQPGTDDAQAPLAVRDQLDRGFRHLRPQQRAVLVAHYYLGLPDGEAASALDIPIGTYKSRLNRAASALRAAIEADARTPNLARESIR
jgi:RNA polymerase sigma-70 factor (ECF subfamily)